MGLLSSLGSGFFIIALIFGAGYSYGHKSYTCDISNIETTLQNVKCRLKLGKVLKLGDNVVVCYKVKAK